MLRFNQVGERIAASTKAVGPPPASARGAVSVVLLGSRGPLRVLLIERAEREDDPWSGQIAFPGGKRQPGDRTPLDTAKRETKEEVGFSLNRTARLLGGLPARSPANRLEWVVVPYIFALSRTPRLAPGKEVARAFWADLEALPGTLHKAVIRLPFGEMETPAFEVEGMPLWGFSFRVLCDFFDIVGSPGSTARQYGTRAKRPIRSETD